MEKSIIIDGKLTGYTVTDQGEIIGPRKKLLKKKRQKTLYETVILKNKTLYVHRLVAMAFLEKIEGKTVVNHKNGIKYDNRLINLEWVTQSENMKHFAKSKIKDDQLGEIEFLQAVARGQRLFVKNSDCILIN